MKNDLSGLFGRGFSRSLAGVSPKDDEQRRGGVLQEVVAGVNMAAGLQGKGDWESAATKIGNMALLLKDNAATEELRKEAGDIGAAAMGALKKLSTEEPGDARDLIRQLGNDLLKAAGINKDGTPWSDPAVKPIPPVGGPTAEAAEATTEAEENDWGRGGKGACGGERRRDGSGRGVGNRGTPNQPK